nr:MAG: major capsid protein [Microvirus sp.]
MANSKLFHKTGGIRPSRSAFNLSQSVRFDADFGELIPVFCRKVVPGDTFQLGQEAVVRTTPLVAPIYDGIDFKTYTFFMPLRLLMGRNLKDYDTASKKYSNEGEFEDFISKGVSGNDNTPVPRWNVTNNAQYSLWDYFGFPVGVKPAGYSAPEDWMRRMYNIVYNEYFRDENLMDPVPLDNEKVLFKCWKKDYFTSALPWQQRGTSAGLPISGQLPVSGHVVFDRSDSTQYIKAIAGAAGNYGPIEFQDDPESSNKGFLSLGTTGITDLPNSFSGNADLSSAATFDVTDLRLAFQIQKWQERNARGGVRYTEFLQSHFGVSPRDDRLQRPEQIGFTTSPITVSEVLQTSQTSDTSPQGKMAGHGLGASVNRIGSYTAQEFGIIMTLACIVPHDNLYLRGIPREWLYETPYDYFFPEFVNLSEQPIFTGELYMTNNEKDNLKEFGYQGRYDEMRCSHNYVAGGFRDKFLYWTLARKFNGAPLLNSSFVTMEAALPELKRIFAVQNEKGFLIDYAEIVRAIRPLPVMSNPGLIDHN